MLFSVAAIFSACDPQETASNSKGVEEPIWGEDAPATVSWIDKTARALRYGSGLTWEDNVEELSKKTKGEVVDYFMTDPRFGDTVLDFNLHFLGFRPRVLKRRDDYAFEVFEFSQAIGAAQAVMRGVDGYDALFKIEQPAYAMPLEYPPFIPSQLGDTTGMSDEEIVALAVKLSDEGIDEILHVFKDSSGGFDREKACEYRASGRLESNMKFDYSLSLIAPVEGFIQRSRLLIDYSAVCSSLQKPLEPFYERLEAVKQKVRDYVEHLKDFDYRTYKTTYVTDIKQFGNKMKEGPSLTFWAQVQNSSTNYNRKRGAYVLKTYFCDDLTPIDVVAPDEPHGDDRHASEPSCQACHYKLDPMAGFFRYNGFFGLDFADDYLLFDDGASISSGQFTDYQNSWKRDGDWNVGYIRSNLNSEMNSYELDHTRPLSELYRIIGEAPEVKQCLARRMAEYFIGTEQVFDGKFIQMIANDQKNPNSTEGFKRAVKRLVVSNTFSMDNPDPQTCYDPPRKEGEESGGIDQLPCAIAYIVQKNCKTCHPSGFEVEYPEMRQMMLSRLTSGEPDYRMPLNREMPDTERAALVKWLNQSLSQPGGNQ
jgi:hypothetical protein